MVTIPIVPFVVICVCLPIAGFCLGRMWELKKEMKFLIGLQHQIEECQKAIQSRKCN